VAVADTRPLSKHVEKISKTMKKAIIVGASSGTGKSLAQILAEAGYRVGLAARRLSLLLDSQQEIGNPTLVKQIDVSNISDATFRFSELIQEMDGVDLIIISAGTGFMNSALDWDKENETIAVNVTGFAAIANIAPAALGGLDNTGLAQPGDPYCNMVDYPTPGLILQNP
jgi:short-subunit dehydrogenase